MVKPKPIFHRGHNQRGILLLHGFTGSTMEMKPLADHLQGIGYGVCAPLLAGHGTSPQDMRWTTWRDWYRSAEEGYIQLQESGARVIYAAGLSMGGLLALKLAGEYPLRAIATLSSPIHVHDRRIKLARWLKYVVPYTSRKEKKPPHIESRISPYWQTPLACVASLHDLIEETKMKLPEIQTPILIAQSGQDETVDPASADYIYTHIGSNYKKIIRYPESSHLITLDVENWRLFMDIARFFEEVTLAIEGKIHTRTDRGQDQEEM